MPRKTKDSLESYRFKDNRIAELITGKKNSKFEDLSKDEAVIGYAITHPKELPMLLRDIADIKATRDMRLGLIAVQVEAELRMHEDLKKYQEQKYVSQTIEKILYGDVLLEGGVKLEDEKRRKKRR